MENKATLYAEVLVPFYRGAVVFEAMTQFEPSDHGSRPLLSRSGCI